MTEDKLPDENALDRTPDEEAAAEDAAASGDEETATDSEEEAAPSAVTSAVVDVTGTDAAKTGEVVEGNPNHV